MHLPCATYENLGLSFQQLELSASHPKHERWLTDDFKDFNKIKLMKLTYL